MNTRRWIKFGLMPIGAICGYYYYSTVGCADGSCGLSSNGYFMTFYGSTLGYFIGSIFTPRKKPEAPVES